MVLDELVEKVCGPGKVVFLLGASDTGKTTLCRHLLEEGLRRGMRCAYLDADIGQSVIGPPTTLGLSLLEGEEDLRSLPASYLYFAGAVSPAQCLLPSVVGARRLLDKALQWGAQFVVVDTTGLVAGDVGFQLKYHKIEALGPSDVVAIERDGELRPILRALKGRCLAIHSVKPHPEVRSRDFGQRQSYRALRWREYLSEAREAVLPLGEKPVVHPALPLLGPEGLERMKGRALGLIGEEGFALGVGVLMGVEGDRLRILTPLEDLGGVVLIQVGAYNLFQDAQRVCSPTGGLGG